MCAVTSTRGPPHRRAQVALSKVHSGPSSSRVSWALLETGPGDTRAMSVIPCDHQTWFGARLGFFFFVMFCVCSFWANHEALL